MTNSWAPIDEEAAKLRVKQLFHDLAIYDSQNRAAPLLSALERQPINVFWPILMANWSSCDRMAAQKTGLLRIMTEANKYSPSRPYLSEKAREWFDSLPDPITVYRGCSKWAVRGLSWTTDKEIAEGFSRGHRYIMTLFPVLAQAKIPKSAVFFAAAGGESEIVLNPRRLRSLQVSKRRHFYFGTDPRDGDRRVPDW